MITDGRVADRSGTTQNDDDNETVVYYAGDKAILGVR
jgi:hypothetical protein